LIAILEGKTVKDERHWRVERMAASALGSIGPEARAAVPALLKFRKRAEVHLKEVKAGQAARGVLAKSFDPVIWEAELPFEHAVEALKKISE
jgi:hypothetical protein